MRETYSRASRLGRRLAFSAVAKGVILFAAVCQMCQAINKSRAMSNVEI